jgi:hypothetical protein
MVDFGERAAMAADRLGARPRGGRGGLNRAWARPTMTAGDDGQDAAVLRRSSADARTAGPRRDRRSAACTTRVRRGDGGNRGISGAASTWGRRVGLGWRATSSGGALGGARVRTPTARARRRGATSWSRARPARFYFAELQFEQE